MTHNKNKQQNNITFIDGLHQDGHRVSLSCAGANPANPTIKTNNI